MDYKGQLTSLFSDSHVSEQQIDEVITIVLQQYPALSPEEQREEMINLLIESGDSTLATNNDNEGAVGYNVGGQAGPSREAQINEHFEGLLTMFPDICPNYLSEFCRKYEHFDFNTVVEDLARTDYVKLDKDPLDVWEHLKQMLPNADPTYLRNQARVLVNRPEGEIERFIENAIEKNDYPTMKDYLINKELNTELELYTTKFSVDEYLKRVPNPVEKFLDPERKSSLVEDKVNEDDLEFALNFLYNLFTYQRKKDISKIFRCYDMNLVKTCNKLRVLPKAFRHPRQTEEQGECKNIDLLKEISFLKHEKVIRQCIKQKNDKYRAALMEAKELGLLQTCACCFDDQLIPEECFFCIKGCIFCKECVKRGSEHVIGKEETVFPCLADCDSQFDYSTLQMVLDEKTFRSIWHRRQIEEIRNANLDGLETCPFCDFCMIPNEGDKIFKCGNIECMKESCRKCRHESHIPLRCEEIEYDEDVKLRTFIENKMTEALLRKCWKCGKQFYKESGCNKMTCVCGAKMCYVCGQAVRDYSHFSQTGCPLYTENLQQFHLNRVLQGAEIAKNELGIKQNPTKLKFDPTRGLENQIH